MAKDKEEKDDKDEGEDLVIVTKDKDDLEVPPTGDQALAEDEETPPKKKVKDEDEDQEEPEDERIGASEESDEEDDQQKKTSHKSRRQRQKEAEKRLRLERDFLERRNEQLERELQETRAGTDERLGAVEKSNLENKIAYAKGIIKKAEEVMAEATSKGRGEENVEATKIRDEWKDHLKELETARKEMDEEPEKPHQPPPANPRVVKMAKDWYEAHPWFDFSEKDRDSKIVGILDKEIAGEGYDPTTQEYWDELSKRVKEALPHRVGKKKPKKNGRDDEEDEDEEEQLEASGEDEEEEKPKPKPKKGKGGPMFRTGGPGRDLKPNEVYLNRDRIAALKELGVWDDPKLRAKYLKKYQDWDRDNPGATN